MDDTKDIKTDGSPRPWAPLIPEGNDNPWAELAAFEEWIKSLIHSDTVEYFENAPSGFSSYLYAGLAAAFDQARESVEEVR